MKRVGLLGQRLIEDGKITPDQLEIALCSGQVFLATDLEQFAQ